MTRHRITEYLDLDLDQELWLCNRCDRALGPASEPYKRGCLVYDRDPTTLYPPMPRHGEAFAPDPTWCRIVEFYCPGCATMLEVEVLPPGHPITNDIDLDIAALKARPGEDATSSGATGRSPAEDA